MTAYEILDLVFSVIGIITTILIAWFIDKYDKK